MGLGDRFGRVGKAALLLAVGAAGAGAAFAVAAVPSTNGTVYACYEVTTTQAAAGGPVSTVPDISGPNLQIIDPSAGQSCGTLPGSGAAPIQQATLDFNQTGPPGAPGATGPAGRTETVAAGQTLTIAGGEVITVGGSSDTGTVDVLTPSKKSVAELTLNGAGAGTVSFPVLNFTTIANNGAGAGGAGTGASGGKVRFGEFSITKKLDSASPKLAQALAAGQHYKTATITVRKAGKGQQEFLVYTFSEVFTSTIQWASSDQSPTEAVTFEYGALSIRYSQQDTQPGKTKR